MTAKNKTTLKSDNTTTFPSATGNILAENERTFNDDVIDSYLNTQETATQSMNGDIDMQGNNITNTGNISPLYDGVDTEANILALVPATYTGQTWFANDTQIAIKSIVTKSGPNAWQKLTPTYDPSTNSFNFPATQDGVSIGVGLEDILNVFNNGVVSATELDPKVFMISTAVSGDEQYMNCVAVTSNDISLGRPYGLNTTSLNTMEYGKLTTRGLVNGIDTSAWTVNDILYVDPTTAGGLTNVPPSINAFVIGQVTKVDPTAGIIFVEAGGRVDPESTLISIEKIFFTGDTVVTGAGTFFRAQLEDEGIVTSATGVVVVDDNQTLGLPQDHLSDVFIDGQTIIAGIREGSVNWEINNSNSDERIAVEVYLADNTGVVEDSGTGAPVGLLGVPYIFEYQTSLMIGIPQDVPQVRNWRGILQENYNVPPNKRLRFHIKCTKVGTVGGAKTFTIYFGSDHDTLLNTIAQVNTNYNVIEDNGAALPSRLSLNLIGATVADDFANDRTNATFGQGVFNYIVISVPTTILASDLVGKEYLLSGSAPTATPILTLPDPASLPLDWAITVHNGSFTGNIQTIVDNVAAVVAELESAARIRIFRIGGGYGVESISYPILNLVLDPVIYGDLNAVEWGDLQDGYYVIFALGSEIFNQPPEIVLTPASNYFITAYINNTTIYANIPPQNNFYSQSCQISTDSSWVNNSRPFARSGISFSAAITNGWQVTQFTSDSGGTTGYTTIQNNGIALPPQPVLNFLNPQSIVNNGGNSSTDVTLPSASSSVISFSSFRGSGTQTLFVAVETTIIGNVANSTQRGTAYNSTTGITTIPVGQSGIWVFSVNGGVNINGTNVPPILTVRVRLNGTIRSERIFPYNNVGVFQFAAYAELDVVTGDTITVSILNGTGQAASVQGSTLLYNVRYVGM